MKKIVVLLSCLALFVLAGCGIASNASDAKKDSVELQVSAAASLTDAMNEIATEYAKEHPQTKVVFNFGSSGALQQAIENGGNADLFFSAAQKQMDALEKAGLLADGTRKNLLENEVVLIVPKDGGKDIASFDALATPTVSRVALGELKGVPVGQYTEEILTKLGILDQVKAKAVYGSDVRQVLSWTETGDVDCGIVYATDAAVSDKVKVAAKAPAGSHKPVIYPAAILKDTKHMEEAKAFLDFVSSEKGMTILKKYGFEAAEK